MSTWRMIRGAMEEPLNVVHHLLLLRLNTTSQVLKRDIIEDACDRPIDIGPNRLEMTGRLAFAVVQKIAGLQTRKLNERPADAPNHITNGYLIGGTRQDVSTFRSPLAAYDVHALENLHNLEQKFQRN